MAIQDPTDLDHAPGGDAHTRRGFLKGVGALAAALGVSSIPFGDRMPAGLLPVALAQGGAPAIPGKDGLTILNDRPLNAETPATLLDDEVTPNARHFVRNNGLVPKRAEARDLAGWSLTIDGEVATPLTLTLDALQKDFPVVERALVLECGGNGRAGFNPPAKGNQWTLGAVGCALYTGVRLRDVLKRAGVKPTAVYLAYEGEDVHLSGDATKPVISRGVPIAKALEDDCLLVWAMNGEPLPALHGWPLRLMTPGFPASASGKWLKRLWVRDVVHDGAKMTGDSYRVPAHPVEPGAKVAAADMKIIEAMPVKSIITAPGTGAQAKAGEALALRGQAWSGAGDVAAMHVSIDFGATWVAAKLARPRNRFAWQRWQADVTFPTAGYYEVWARATDHKGAMQPMVVPGWNPKGYLNNAMHRIAVRVA